MIVFRQEFPQPLSDTDTGNNNEVIKAFKREILFRIDELERLFQSEFCHSMFEIS